MYNFQLDDPYFLPHLGAKIDISIPVGKLVTLVGENGIGKSSLAHRFWKDHITSCSMIEQSPLDIFYDRPLGKIKDILIESRGLQMDEFFFHSIWDKFGLSKKEGRLHSQLSGGEGQALKICLGLAQSASCYILDEPSQYLDRQSKQVLSELMVELLQQNKSILLIEHDLEWVKVSNTILQLGISQGVLTGVKSWTI